MFSHLKGQSREIFDHFFGLKDSTWAPYEQAKTVSQNFLFSRRYSIAKFVNCVSALTTLTHVRVVVDCADTVSA